ncbi:MAG: hypothetical protein ACLQPH_15020 [Acidimicrobiales bacterium]
MGSDRGAEFGQWKSECVPILRSLMSTLNMLDRTIAGDPAGLLATGDQFHAAATEFAGWLPEHRCPVGDIDTALSRLFRSVESVGALLFEESGRRRPNARRIVREVDGVMDLLSKTWALMYEHSEK